MSYRFLEKIFVGSEERVGVISEGMNIDKTDGWHLQQIHRIFAIQSIHLARQHGQKSALPNCVV